MITIRNLVKSLNGKKVLDGIELEVGKGETVVVIGCSGSGKSVLLKTIIGLLHPEGGQILVDGEDITRMGRRKLNEKRKKFGMLFQELALFDSLSVGENVGFALHQHTRLDEEEIRRRVAEKLRMVGLEGLEELYPSQLSGGMRKRVGLARAIAMEPEIILYDEPTTGLDPITGNAINELIVDLKERLSITSVAVTHDMNSAYRIGNRIAMLYNGRIVGTGTPEEIRRTEDPVIRQFVTGSAKGPITEEQLKTFLKKPEISEATAYFFEKPR